MVLCVQSNRTLNVSVIKFIQNIYLLCTKYKFNCEYFGISISYFAMLGKNVVKSVFSWHGLGKNWHIFSRNRFIYISSMGIWKWSLKKM